MRLWFDTESGELVTEKEMIREYAIKIINMCVEDGIPEAQHTILENEYTFEDFLKDCTTPWNGTLIPVVNADKFKEV